MKSFLLCSLFLVLGLTATVSKTQSTTCNCGWTNSGRIVGGKQTRQNEYPWMASLSNSYGQSCGGSIITPWHVLTAAHCVEHEHTYTFRIVVGDYNLAGNPDVYGVSKIVIHEGYTSGYDQDIAIVVTATRIEFSKTVGPVCLPTAPVVLDNQIIKITGWGEMEHGKLSNFLNEVDVKVMPKKECLKHWGVYTSLKNQICVTGLKKGSCFGDSGGPLVLLDRSSNRYTQVALVSFGEPGICAGAKPTVDTDVSAYIDWVHRVINRTKPGTKTCSAPNSSLRNFT